MSTITYDDDNLIKFTQLGLEDLFWGEGTQTVTRFGEEYVITEINAGNMPFDASRTLQEVLDDEYPSVEIVGNDIASVKTVADNITPVIEVGTDPLKTAILGAGDNAVTAQLEAWNAIAAQMTADSYAVEPEDTFVKVYTSNDDGTYTETETTDNSSLHWAAKAGETSGGDASWGSITGVLSAQTDLQDALNLKLNVDQPDFTGAMEGPGYQLSGGSYGSFQGQGDDAILIGGSVLSTRAEIRLQDHGGDLYLSPTGLLYDGDKVPVSDITETGATVINNLVYMTQAAYDALPTKVTGTVYFIVG